MIGGEGLAVWDWFLGLFNKEDGTLKLNVCAGEITAEIFYKELAINVAINLISNTLSNAEFQTFEKGKEVKKDNYYLFNVEPNQNKSANKFWRDVIYRLVYDNECLVVMVNDMFYIADSFDIQKYALKENIYTNIEIDGYPLREIFRESDVLHFELHNQKIKTVIDGLYSSYGKLITSSSKHNLRKRAKRGTLEIPGSYPQTEEAYEDLQDLLENRFRTYFEAETGAVLPLSNGLKFEEAEERISNNPSQEGRDIRAFIDDVFDFVALAFQIPPQLLKGDVADTEKAVNNFITFCINPLADLLTDEINRKYYGKELYLQRTYVKLDTSRIKHIDIEDVANAMDILFRIGANTINDNLRILGREEIDEEWADERFITKNYDTIDNFMEGGD